MRNPIVLPEGESEARTLAAEIRQDVEAERPCRRRWARSGVLRARAASAVGGRGCVVEDPRRGRGWWPTGTAATLREIGTAHDDDPVEGIGIVVHPRDEPGAGTTARRTLLVGGVRCG